jgi:hypothetical protein
LGRRTRSKAQQQGAAKGVVKAQQLARVNVSLEAWQEFRIRAMRGGTTVADYLGELVKKELQRPAPKASPPATSRPGVGLVEPVSEAPIPVPSWEE